MLSSPSSLEDIVKLKEKGSRLFKLKKIEKAVKIWEKALKSLIDVMRTSMIVNELQRAQARRDIKAKVGEREERPPSELLQDGTETWETQSEPLSMIPPCLEWEVLSEPDPNQMLRLNAQIEKTQAANREHPPTHDRSVPVEGPDFGSDAILPPPFLEKPGSLSTSSFVETDLYLNLALGYLKTDPAQPEKTIRAIQYNASLLITAHCAPLLTYFLDLFRCIFGNLESKAGAIDPSLPPPPEKWPLELRFEEGRRDTEGKVGKGPKKAEKALFRLACAYEIKGELETCSRILSERLLPNFPDNDDAKKMLRICEQNKRKFSSNLKKLSAKVVNKSDMFSENQEVKSFSGSKSSYFSTPTENALPQMCIAGEVAKAARKKEKDRIKTHKSRENRGGEQKDDEEGDAEVDDERLDQFRAQALRRAQQYQSTYAKKKRDMELSRRKTQLFYLRMENEEGGRPKNESFSLEEEARQAIEAKVSQLCAEEIETRCEAWHAADGFGGRD